ncbi:CDP-alcohol phosphatidyltransferase family protein [Fodinibius sediminis]|uniref:CDP-diacylglycerol--glycerol-3-phosphate 3-phosphatidyltransferase n=1 Tax=Fodinibius sediminis TaxID=1214077 RepID=A0A521BID5_9BACT|nr:CDP-alcohol phosphatidyltransferase family protein [Fodinibius sediminis]SMO46661.1 CDP-diacylglycerol--glycerol-3-phosphate 3-phosphatidyltransferase [Fodinibius sediminis]
MTELHNIERQKVEVRQILFTWSNLISFTRILVAVPIVYLHYTNGQRITWVIAALVFYGIISDYLDGFVARWTNQVSEWGKILDPVADKFCAFILFLYAVYIDLIPLWFFLIEIIRDIVIMGGSLYIQKMRGKVAMAGMSGKVSVNALGLYWLSVFFYPGAEAVHLVLMGNSLALMFFSFFDYLHRFNQIRKGVYFN